MGDGVLTELTVGAVESRVTEGAVDAAAGLMLLTGSSTLPAASTGMTVPFEQFETVRLIEEAIAADGVKMQPVAVPALLKSTAAMPLTVSEKLSDHTSVADGVGVAGDAVHVAVAGVRSTVTVPALSAVDGAVFPAASETPSAARRGMRVPLPQPVTTMLIEVPEAVEGANEQPVAVPALVKSPAATPTTVSLKVIGKVIEVEFVGEVGVAPQVTVGAVRSTVIELPSEITAGPLFPAVSVTELAAIRGWTVPAPQPLTTRLIEVPVAAEGVKTHPTAEPTFVKSLAAMPETASLKVIGKVRVAELFGVEGGVPHVTVGTTASRTTVWPVEATAGPVFPDRSVTELTVRRGMIEPEEQPVATTLIEAPLETEGVKVQPVALPSLVKSAAAIPVTDSEKLSAQVMLEALVGVGGAVPQLAVGLRRSIVTELASRAVPGAVLPAASLTDPAAICGIRVPSEQPVTTTFTDVPLAADGAKVQPVAVPALLKSPAAIPDAVSLKVIGNVSDDALVGEDGADPQVTVGAVRSIVTVDAASRAVGPRLPSASETELAASLAITVPLAEQPLTETLMTVPEELAGVKVHPVAVPPLVKSDDSSPETALEKVSV